MDWRLLLAAAMVLVTLLGGTVLVAQVENDLATHVDVPMGETAIQPPDDLPFKLKGLKLPSDLPVQLPEGTLVKPDLGRLELPKDLDLTLPEDLDLSDLGFDLPEDFDLRLPEGTRFDGSRLTLPDGAEFRMPDGSTVTIPPGVSLDLPPEVARRLLEQGLPLGTLPSGRSFSFDGLPPGLGVGVDPPALTGGGTLRLPAGTVIQLPPGTALPAGLAAGALAHGMGYVLPPGTTFDVPLTDGSRLRGSVGPQMPIPQPRVAPPQPPTPAEGEDPRGVPVVTEIDRLPSRVRKGEAFRVEGYVRERDTGRGVADAPVEVFLNETKEAPGTLVGRTISDASGRFALTLDIPREKPARQYQLVNHASPFTAASGVRYEGGWGDPPLYTYASTSLQLNLPSNAALRAQTILSGRVIDAVGAPVESGIVEVFVDNASVFRAAAGPGGAFSGTFAFQVLGVRQVEARYLGEAPYYEPSAAHGTVRVQETAAVEADRVTTVYRGQLASFGGRALLDGVPAAYVEIDVATPFAPSARATTDARGRFTSTFPVPWDHPLGDANVVYVYGDKGVTVTQRIEVASYGTLGLSVPPSASLKGEGVRADVRLEDDRGAPLAGIPVTVRLAGPGGAKEISAATDEQGVALFALLPSVLTPGEYTVTASLAPSTHVLAVAPPAKVLLGDVEVRWSVPPVAVRGKDVVVDATITRAGSPLGNAQVTLDLFGKRLAVTDEGGAVRWAFEVPADAAGGPHKATLLVPYLEGVAPTKETRVVAVPRLGFDTSGEYDPREGVLVNVTLSDDGRAPMADAPVEVTFTAGNWTRTHRLTTDARGNWSGLLDTRGAPAANLTAVARHHASPASLEAEASRTVTVSAAAFDQPVEGGNLWLLPLMLATVVGGLGAGAWLVRRRLRRDAPAAPAAEEAPAPVAPALAQTRDLDLRLGIPEGEPLLWGVGEPLPVEVRSRGDARPGALVMLRGQDHEAPLHLDEAGRAASVLVARREGDLRVVARRPDEPASLPVEVRVEVVDYRRAVAREFDAVVDAAAGAGLAVTRRSTPREVEAALLARLGDEAAPLLDEVALLMEVTNYSRAPVARREFLRFLDASTRLLGLLRARRPEAR